MLRIMVVLLLVASLANAGAAETHPGAEAFIARAANEHGFDPGEVEALLAEARYQQSIVDAMTRPAEAKPWYDYRPIFLTDQRIDGGVAFWRENEDLIQQAAQKFSVDPQVIVAIIGVETFYGRITGNYRVIDALATLGFHYPKELTRDRSEFFASELLQFLLLGREERLPVGEVTGSYAGAMGMGQFIPSSYRSYAVDFDGDGSRDLWRSKPDAVASVANYLHRHGWIANDPVAARAFRNGGTAENQGLIGRGYKPSRTVAEIAELGFVAAPDVDPARLAAVLELEEKERPAYWLTFDNFYVITRYNRSPLYAMAVLELSQEIAAAREGP